MAGVIRMVLILVDFVAGESAQNPASFLSIKLTESKLLRISIRYSIPGQLIFFNVASISISFSS